MNGLAKLLTYLHEYTLYM